MTPFALAIWSIVIIGLLMMAAAYAVIVWMATQVLNLFVTNPFELTFWMYAGIGLALSLAWAATRRG